MRRLRDAIGMSLDGQIATPDDETAWMSGAPEYDPGPFFDAIDTVLLGRRCYELAVAQGTRSWPGYRTYVFSRTLRQEDYPEVTVVRTGAATVVRALRAEQGKDIWLLGGGVLFQSLLAADLVDTMEVGISPILLGRGIPLLPPPGPAVRLILREHEVYGTGLVVLRYDVQHRSGRRQRAPARHR